MARKPRVEFPGAIYHVLDRGLHGERIFEGDEDRTIFLTTLGEACERANWRAHAYALMSDHYHLVIETPEPNLVGEMHWFQATWTIRFNRRRGLRGRVLQGRYKAVMVEPKASGYLTALSDYLHLNPVRAGIVKSADRLLDYGWSSYPAYVAPNARPEWLTVHAVMGELGMDDSAAGRKRYAQRMRQRARAELAGENETPERALLRRGWYLGGEAFRQKMLRMMETTGGATRHRSGKDAAVPSAHDEAKARRLLARGLKVVGLTKKDLMDLPKSDERKAVLAAMLKSLTAATNEWVARELFMGQPSRVAQSVKIYKNDPLRKKLEAAVAK